MMKKAERLQNDVVDELGFDPKVDSSEIGITATAEGVVTLEGSVKTYQAKRAAEAATKRVAGVRAVVNDIEVRPTGKHRRDDTAMAEAALNALQWDAMIPSDGVKVKISKGWITLEGEVEWQFQKTAAYNAVRHLFGAKGVTNNITVKPKVSASDVRTKIKDAFRRSAQIDADQIRVETEGGKVILRGRVHSWAELDEAEEAAWSVPGVTEVDNRVEFHERVYA